MSSTSLGRRYFGTPEMVACASTTPALLWGPEERSKRSHLGNRKGVCRCQPPRIRPLESSASWVARTARGAECRGGGHCVALVSHDSVVMDLRQCCSLFFVLAWGKDQPAPLPVSPNPVHSGPMCATSMPPRAREAVTCMKARPPGSIPKLCLCVSMPHRSQPPPKGRRECSGAGGGISVER